MNDEMAHMFNSLLKTMEYMQRDIDKQEKQIARLIQCIGEFDLNEAQRYYLHKAIWGTDDE